MEDLISLLATVRTLKTLRDHNWVHFTHRLYIRRYLRNLKLFSINLKNYLSIWFGEKEPKGFCSVYSITFLRNLSLSNARCLGREMCIN